MKILFIGNTAGACSPLANWLVENSHEVRMIEKKERDRFGRVTVFKDVELFDNWREIADAIVDIMKEWKPDIVHVNSHVIYLIVARAASFTVPIVLQFHGSEIRGKKIPYEAKLANEILVSTIDLDKYGLWIGCMVSDFFQDKGGRKEGTALLIVDPKSDIDYGNQAAAFCEKNGFELDIRENVSHKELPEILSKYEYYLDFKRLGSFSMLAFQAHRCGCKIVLFDDLGWTKLFPSKDVEYFIGKPERYMSVYERLNNFSKIGKMKYIMLSKFTTWLSCLRTRKNIYRGLKSLKRRVYK